MKQIIKISILSVLLVSIIATFISFTILGGKERVGYIEVSSKNEKENEYRVRINYYDKIFRNSDIYGVYVKTESLPDELKNIKFDREGSPFADVTSDTHLESGTRFENIIYTLEVKKIIRLMSIFLIILLIVSIMFNRDVSNIFIQLKNKGFYETIYLNYDKILVFTIVSFALLVRIDVINFKTGDYNVFLRWWYLHFADNGIGGFKDVYVNTNANYPPIYLIIVAIMSYLPHPTEYFILLWMKVPQIIADFVLAYYVFKIVREYTKKNYMAIIAMALILFAPISLLNGALWAQSDVLYTLFAIISAFYLYKEQYFKSFLLLGFSIAFKTMGIFLLPIFIMLTIKRKINLKYYLLIPFPHIIATLIATLFGANFKKALSQLFERSLGFMGINSANLSTLLSIDILSSYLILLSIIFCAVYLYLFLNSKKELTFDNFVLWCFITTFTMPFILPGMRERFFYLSEILAILYVFMKPKYAYIAIGMHISVLSTYLNYLEGGSYFSLQNSALLMLVVFCLALRALYIENFKVENIINDRR